MFLHDLKIVITSIRLDPIKATEGGILFVSERKTKGTEFEFRSGSLNSLPMNIALKFLITMIIPNRCPTI